MEIPYNSRGLVRGAVVMAAEVMKVSESENVRHSVVSDSATPWTLCMGFSKQEYWSGLPCSHPGELPNAGMELKSLMSAAVAGWLSTTSATWEAWMPERVIAN